MKSSRTLQSIRCVRVHFEWCCEAWIQNHTELGSVSVPPWYTCLHYSAHCINIPGLNVSWHHLTSPRHQIYSPTKGAGAALGTLSESTSLLYIVFSIFKRCVVTSKCCQKRGAQVVSVVLRFNRWNISGYSLVKQGWNVICAPLSWNIQCNSSTLCTMIRLFWPERNTDRWLSVVTWLVFTRKVVTVYFKPWHSRQNQLLHLLSKATCASWCRTSSFEKPTYCEKN